MKKKKVSIANSNICVAKGCSNLIYIKKHKLCKPHANQLYQTGYVKNAPCRKNKTHDEVVFV